MIDPQGFGDGPDPGLTNRPGTIPFDGFDAIVNGRLGEADEFYGAIHPPGLDDDRRAGPAQAYAGILWSKQFYHYSVELWLDGDPAGPPPPAARLGGAERGLATRLQPRRAQRPRQVGIPLVRRLGHGVPLHRGWRRSTRSGPSTRSCCCSASGTCTPRTSASSRPTSGTSPTPIRPCTPTPHSRVYQIDRETSAQEDNDFLEEVFHKLLLNFTWWVNRKDPEGRNGVPGRFPGPGQHRGLRPEPSPTSPTAAGSSRPTAPPGWRLFCLDMLCDRAGAVADPAGV